MFKIIRLVSSETILLPDNTSEFKSISSYYNSLFIFLLPSSAILYLHVLLFWHLLYLLLLSSSDPSAKATPQHPSFRTFAPKHRVQLGVICCILIVISLQGEDQPLSQHGGRAPADAPRFLNVELIQEAARHGGWLVVA